MISPILYLTPQLGFIDLLSTNFRYQTYFITKQTQDIRRQHMVKPPSPLLASSYFSPVHLAFVALAGDAKADTKAVFAVDEYLCCPQGVNGVA